MNLYRLTRTREDPRWDIHVGFVIRAKDEFEAREMARDEAGSRETDTWINPDASTCCRLFNVGEPEIVIKDYSAG